MISSLNLWSTHTAWLINLDTHEARRDLVGSRSKFAIHIVKQCLGTPSLNQTSCVQSLVAVLGLTASQVREEEKTLQVTPATTQSYLSFLASAFGGSIVVRWARSSKAMPDLAAGNLHWFSKQASETVACKGTRRFLGPEGPKRENSCPSGVQTSN